MKLMVKIAVVAIVAGLATPSLAQIRYDDGGLEHGPVSRFVLSGSQWTSSSLNYSFQNFTADLTQVEVESAIANAFALWSSACPNLVVSKIADSGAPFNDASATPPTAGDFRIQFGAGNHGDSYPFDGSSGVLAHAYYPPPNGVTSAGDTHFDEDETWTLNAAGPGIHLPTVAAHEFGHALGLKHEPSIDAIMNPFYSGARVLSADDITAIRTLYCPTRTGSVLPVDLVFVLDLTGSMDDDLPTIQSAIPTILQSIVNILPNTRLGLVTFQDFPISPFGDATDVPFQVVLPLGTPTNVIRTTIESLVATGGNDWPESQYNALNQTVTAATVGLQPGRLPVIFLITDADFHDADTEAGYPIPGRAATIAALKARGAKVFTMLSATPPDLSPGQAGPDGRLPDLGLAMIGLEDAADELAVETGGGAMAVGFSSSEIAPAMNTALAQVSEESDCGNNTTEGAEQCDGSDAELCPGVCEDDCLCPFTSCGNNIQEGGEQCDGVSDSVCPGLCLSTCFCDTVPICGNNTTEGSEQCDGVDDGLCPLNCGLDCTCPVSCGDGSVNQPSEECDDGNVAPGDGCDASCQLEGCPLDCGRDGRKSTVCHVAKGVSNRTICISPDAMPAHVELHGGDYCGPCAISGAGALSDLIGQVTSRGSRGPEIDAATRERLLQRLRRALNSIAAGRFGWAERRLQSFTTMVERLTSRGLLTEDQAATFIVAAEAAMAELR